MIVAVASDQNPPIVMPSSARAAMSIAKFCASAIRTSEASMSPVSTMSTWRRSKRPAMVAMNRLVTTANSPEIEIAWPAIPSVALKSAAIGVSKLTGKNSEAMSIETHRVIDPTALQGFGVAASICWFVAVAIIVCRLG